MSDIWRYTIEARDFHPLKQRFILSAVMAPVMFLVILNATDIVWWEALLATVLMSVGFAVFDRQAMISKNQRRFLVITPTSFRTSCEGYLLGRDRHYELAKIPAGSVRVTPTLGAQRLKFQCAGRKHWIEFPDEQSAQRVYRQLVQAIHRVRQD